MRYCHKDIWKSERNVVCGMASHTGKIDMIRGSIIKSAALFALPICVGNILQQLYGTVDTLVVGNFCDSAALAAVGTATQPMEILLCVFLGIGNGASILVSQEMGRRNADGLRMLVRTAVWFLYLCAIPVTILAMFVGPALLRLMQVPADAFDYAVLYLRITALGTLGNLGYNMNAGILRGLGDSRSTLLLLLISCLTNIVLDVAFVAVLGMGVAGAALATAVSPIISIAICSRHFFKKENTLQFVRQMPSVRLLGQSCQLGISGFVGELSSGVTTTVFNFLLLGLAGNVGVAAYGVVANFALVATAIFNGVAQGAQPLVSRCYGQNDHAGARKLLLLGSGTVLVLAAVLYAAVFGLTDPFVSWFNSENSVQMAQYAHTGMRMYFVGYFFAGFNIMAAGYLSAVNRPVEASVTSICRGMVAIVVCSLVLSAVFGMPGVWAAFPASELLTALLTLFLLRRKKAETA